MLNLIYSNVKLNEMTHMVIMACSIFIYLAQVTWAGGQDQEGVEDDGLVCSWGHEYIISLFTCHDPIR